jgi:hypothetical protein
VSVAMASSRSRASDEPAMLGFRFRSAWLPHPFVTLPMLVEPSRESSTTLRDLLRFMAAARGVRR